MRKKNENSAKVDEVKSIITLRGGKQVDQPMPKSKEKKEGKQKKKEKEVNKDNKSKEDEIISE